jgi:hypothetical protein
VTSGSELETGIAPLPHGRLPAETVKSGTLPGPEDLVHERAGHVIRDVVEPHARAEIHAVSRSRAPVSFI